MIGEKSLRSELLTLINSLSDAIALLRKNDPLRMAGATAFFTTFALPPIVFILAQLFGLFIDRRMIGRGLLESISNILGKAGAEQVRQVMRSIRGFSDNWYVITFGFIFLVFVATTLFTVIKNSLNQIWQIGVKERPGFLFGLNMRMRSFVVIILIGILFFADLVFDSLGTIARNYIDEIWKGGGTYFKSVMNETVSVIIVAAWFILLFRYLADGKPSWKASFAGGLLTGILFTAGRLLLRFLLVDSNISHLYGSSASFVLVLLFVFYSSFILYYGACFITVYSQNKDWPMRLNSKSYNYKIEEIQEIVS
ncbi:MAG TPA: YihY/virulence factor BrkB family protein [Chitinophagaceae bacterium]|jgi:membrane protein|nr:YihY/virulence factor BrkB family protein [Chitinophagaceae bacterium]